MEFQILDVDYVLVDGRPVVRVFGKGRNGETVCGFHEGHLPYFYALGKDVEKTLEGDGLVSGIEKVKRALPMGHQEPRETFRITLKNPAKTPEVRDRLIAAGAEVFEADIPFKYRWMNDLGLGGMCWIRTNEGNGSLTNTVQASRMIRIAEMKPMAEAENSPMKYMAFDIETVPLTEGLLPDAMKDPVIMMSCVFEPDYRGRKSVVFSTKTGRGVTGFDSEKEMLEEFIETINGFDPDIITGYNCNNFDFPYILERMRQNGVKPIFGRCRQKYVVARKLMSRHKVMITGRVVVDAFEIVKKDYSLKSYALDNVAPELLGEAKEVLGISGIRKLWKGSEKDFERLVAYSRKDSVLAMNLILRLNLLDKYFALARVSGILLQDILDSGETSRIENLLLREFNKDGYVLPCRPPDSEVKKRERRKKEELKGGYVKEPERGLQSSVVVLDFRSMYPSLIREFNICPTTLVKSDGEGIIKTPSGAMFLPKERKRGIVPRILEGLMEERQAVKKRLKKEKNEEMRRLLDAKQWALKIMSNAFYGHFGYSRARVYSLDIANAVTSLGREIIQATERRISEEFGYKVIYGDTDSVLVKLRTENLEEMEKEGNDISRRITEGLPGIISLEFEKIFRQFLALTKKRYVAWRFERTEEGWKESMEMKGVETVRRDWCTLTSETMKKIIGIILKENNIKLAVDYFRGVIGDIVDRKIPIEKFVITKSITKRPESYEGVQPHVELVKKIMQRNTEAPGVGDRVGYVIVKGTQMLSKRAEDPAYVRETGLELDSRYYIENQLLPPLERIFVALGISKGELLGRGRQVGIFEALKNHMEVQVREVPMGIVNGFICIKCNRPYRRPSLMGKCECGGEILFSSPLGPAEFAVVE